MTAAGQTPSRRRLAALATAAVFAPAFWAAAFAAPLSPVDQVDIKRAYAAGNLSTSEVPTLRAERAQQQPSAGFLLGVALGAWTAARDQLDFDVKNPSAAGPPHATQGAPDTEAFEQDCRDELTAFQHLETRSQTAGMEPEQVLVMADADPALAAAWRARRTGPAAVCRSTR